MGTTIQVKSNPTNKCNLYFRQMMQLRDRVKVTILTLSLVLTTGLFAMAQAPVITSVEFPAGNYAIGSTITITINADAAGYTLDGSSTVNGQSLSNFTDATGGVYTADYDVVEGDDDHAAVTSIPISIILDNASETNAAFTTPTTAGAPTTVTIDANRPVGTVSYSANPIRDGVSQTITIDFGEALTGIPKIELSGQETVAATDMADGTQTWTYDAGTTHTGNGTVTVTTTVATDAAGNEVTLNPANNTFEIDNNQPEFTGVSPTNDAIVNTTLVAYTLNQDIVSGTVTWTQVGGTADGGSPHTANLAGSELTSGSFSDVLTNAPTLVSGAIYDISFDATDDAGNTATTVTRTNVTFDNTPPSFSTVEVSPASGTANVGTPITITLTSAGAETDYSAGTSVTVNGIDRKASFNHAGAGVYNVTYTVGETQTDWTAGNLPINIDVSDPAGNTVTVNAFTDGNTLAGDANTPAAPTTPDLAAADDSGFDDTDNITNVASGQTISGTAESGSTVELFVDDVSQGTTTATGGNWSFELALGEGTYVIHATATDAASNTSGDSPDLNLEVDITPPAIPGTPNMTNASDLGFANNDNITNDVTPTFNEANKVAMPNGTTINIYSQYDGLIGTGLSFSSDEYEVTVNPLSPMSEADDHSITAKSMDVAGNESNASGALSPVKIDTTPPQITGSTWVADGGGSSREKVILTFSEDLGLANNATVAQNDEDQPDRDGFYVTLGDATVNEEFRDNETKFIESTNTIELVSVDDGNWASSSVQFTYNNTATYSTDAAQNHPKYIYDIAGNELEQVTFTASDTEAPALATGLIFNPNGTGPEIITFRINEELDLNEGPVQGFTTVPADASLTATYSLKGSRNLITLTASAPDTWTDAVTISYSQTTGDVVDASNNELADFTNEPIRLTGVSISANNANGDPGRAIPGELITLNFTSTTTLSEAPIVTVDGLPATLNSTLAPIYTATITTLTNDGVVPFVISVKTAVDSTAVRITTDGTSLTYDDNPPNLNTGVSIASNNSTNPATHATTGNTISIDFAANEPLFFDLVPAINPTPTPAVTIAGKSATVTQSSPSDYTAEITLDGTEPEGLVAFSIDYEDVPGNPGTQRTTTTDGSSMTIDFTNPVITSINVDPASTFTSFTTSNGVVQPGSVDFIVTFDDPVTGLDADDFTAEVLSGNLVTGTKSISGSGDSYTVTVNLVSGTGQVRLNYPDNDDLTINAVGLPTLVAKSGDQSYTIVDPEPSAAVSDPLTSNVTQSQIQLNWTEGTPTNPPTHYLLLVHGPSGSFPNSGDGFADGNNTFLTNDNSFATDDLVAISVPYGTSSYVFEEGVTVNGLQAGSRYDFKVVSYTLSAGASDDNLDYLLTAPTTFDTMPTAARSSITNGTGASSISSLNTSATTWTSVFSFDITDDENFTTNNLPPYDNVPTKFTALVIGQGPSNTISAWNQAIGGARLLDDEGNIQEADILINAGNITITNIASAVTTDLGWVDDNETKRYTLEIYLQANLSGSENYDNIIDNMNFQFEVNEASFTLNPNPGNGSSFNGVQTANSGSTNNRVDVTATILDWVINPRNIEGINVAVQEPVVAARDANNNLDRDFNFPVSIASGGAGMSGLPDNFSDVSPGILDFPGFQYSTVGNGTLQISANGLNSSSTPVDVIHVVAQALDVLAPPNSPTPSGVATDNPMFSGSINKVILGVLFTSQYSRAGQPQLDDVIIRFNNPTDGVLSNIRLFKSSNTTYDASDINVTNLINVSDGFITVSNINHDFSVAGNLTLFVVADITDEVTSVTPALTPKIEPADITFNAANSYNVTNAVGRTYIFRDFNPPTLNNQSPAINELNFPINGDVVLEFSEIVSSADGVVNLYELDTQNPVATLNLAGSPPLPSQNSVFSFPTTTTVINPITLLPEVVNYLQSDTWYYITVAPGRVTEDPAEPHTQGFRDLSDNEFEGIPELVWRFKTTDLSPPEYVTGMPAEVANTSVLGADLKLALNERGRVYYMVIPSANLLDPSIAQLYTPNSYADTKILSGSFDIDQDSTYYYISLLNDAYAGGGSYEVHFVAQDNGSPPNVMASSSFLTFTTANPAGTGLIVNVPDQDVCVGDFQTLFPPIRITERADADFPNLSNQTFNIALPEGFEFATNATNDIVTFNSGNVTTAALRYINNTLLEVKFSTNGTNQRDVLTISGLEIKATGTSGTTGNIVRSGGNALLASDELPDGKVLGTLTATSIPLITFSNDLNSSIIGNNVEVVQLTTPNLPLSDLGTKVFSGNGVVGDQLIPSLTTIGTQTITLTYTNEEGCVSVYSEDYQIFDNENAIGGLATIYCTDEPDDRITFNGKQGYDLVSVAIDLPEGIIRNNPDTLNSNYYQNILPASLTPDAGEYIFSPAALTNANLEAALGVTLEGLKLGEVFFTAEYESKQTNDIVIFNQQVEIFIQPRTILELNGKERTNERVDICEDTGDLDFGGFPTPSAGIADGYYLVSIPAIDLYNLRASEVDGVDDSNDGSATVNTQELSDFVFADNGKQFGFGEVYISYIYERLYSGCNDTTTQVIRINPTPRPSILAPSILCEDTELEFTSNSFYLPADINLVQTNELSGQAILPEIFVTGWDDDITSPGTNITSDSAIAIYNFVDRGDYTMNLSIRTDFGCVADLDIPIKVGGLPEANFELSGTSQAESFTVQSTSTVLPSTPSDDHAIEQVRWDMNGDGIFETTNNDNDPTKDNDAILNYSFTDPGQYLMEFVAVATTGCSDTLSRPVMVLANVGTAAINENNTYDEEFETTSHGWVTFPETNENWDITDNNSWELGISGSIGAPDPAGTSIWATGLISDYNELERSYVYSPTFDLSQLERPMIALDIYKDLATQDGVLLEYSADSLNILDPDKEWHALGEVEEGIYWFSTVGLAGAPGNDNTGLGWAEDIANPELNDNWITAKHDLGEIYAGKDRATVMSRVNFRIGLGAIEGVKSQGFAFDNVFMGNRTRTVLLEAFTSMNGSSENATQNEAINELVNLPSGAELVLLTYHTSFDGDDILNTANPAQNGARALFYGVSQNHRVAIDGDTNPFNNSGNDILFTEWGEKFYSQRTLQISPFVMDIQLSEEQNKLKINTSITAQEDLQQNLVIHTVVVADSISADDLLGVGIRPESGESYFKGNMLKMLPSASGIKVEGGLTDQETINLETTWDPYDIINPSAIDTDNLRVIVFVQDEQSNEQRKEIHQATYVDLASLPDELNLVLGVEDLISEGDINLYPNPADKRLQIELSKSLHNSQTALIHDNTGRVIEEIKLNAGQDRIELSTLNYLSGIYLFSLPTNNGTVIKRFVVSHR